MNRSTKLQPGFTLIELLVVIAIIALLAAILFPVFQSAREKARQTACLSNSKQLALAFEQYSQDYDEMLPCGQQPSTLPGSTSADSRYGPGWPGDLYAYVKSKAVFVCPDDTVVNSGSVWASPPGDGLKHSDQLSYAYNYNIPQDPAAGVAGVGRGPKCALSKFAEPAMTVLLFEVSGGTARAVDVTNPANPYSPLGNGAIVDGVMTYETGYMGGESGNPGETDSNGDNYNPQARHSAGSNFVLADGHAKWIPPTLVSIGYEAAAGNPGSFPCAPSTYCQAASPSSSGQGTLKMPFTATFGAE